MAKSFEAIIFVAAIMAIIMLPELSHKGSPYYTPPKKRFMAWAIWTTLFIVIIWHQR